MNYLSQMIEIQKYNRKTNKIATSSIAHRQVQYWLRLSQKLIEVVKWR